MPSRMDRYEEEKNTLSRSVINQDLYENIGKNEREIDSSYINVDNAIDINAARANSHTRDGYKKMIQYDSNFENKTQEKQELDEFNYLYKDQGNMIFDLDKYLEDAHSKREKDQEPEKKLSDEKYNILNDKEKLEKYRNRKKVVRPNDESLREIIDTITSKTLAGELDKATTVDLLSDLMATSIQDRVEAQDDDYDTPIELSREVLGKTELQEIKNIEDKTKSNTVMKLADKDFYSKSIELNTKDFDNTQNLDTSFDENKKSHIFLKLVIFILIVIFIALGVYYFITTYMK